MAELLLREATARPDCPEALVAYRISGTTCFYFGDFAGAHEHFQKSIVLDDPACHGHFAYRFGHDPSRRSGDFRRPHIVCAWSNSTILRALPTAPWLDAELDLAHAPTIAHTLGFAALLGLFRCNPEAVAINSQASADIVSRYDMPASWVGHAVYFGAGQSGLTGPKSRNSPGCAAASLFFGSKVGIGS